VVAKTQTDQKRDRTTDRQWQCDWQHSLMNNCTMTTKLRKPELLSPQKFEFELTDRRMDICGRTDVWMMAINGQCIVWHKKSRIPVMILIETKAVHNNFCTVTSSTTDTLYARHYVFTCLVSTIDHLSFSSNFAVLTVQDSGAVYHEWNTIKWHNRPSSCTLRFLPEDTVFSNVCSWRTNETIFISTEE